VSGTRLTTAGLTGTAEAVAPVRERLASMLFLTAIAHAIVILGISFGVARQGAAPPGMEVLRVSDDLPEASRNDNAAYLAQRSQIGAGNTRSGPTGSPSAQAPPVPPAADGSRPTEQAGADARAGDAPVLATGGHSMVVHWLGQGFVAASAGVQADPDADPGELRRGRGDARELVLRGDPKTGRWLAPDTRASRLAPYLDAWRRRVERVGTLNYPVAARSAAFSGSPVVEVAVASDGRLLEAVIQRSSGHVEVDQAALQILRLASPFEAFPKALAHDYGALRFAYQWEFVGGQLKEGAVSTNEDPAPSP
jgi:periplasmic protein TonB